MSLLSVAQDVALSVGIESPDSVSASTTREHQELVSYIKECGRGLRDAADWQALATLATFTGDGSATSFPLPTDWHRAPKDARIWTNRLDGPITQIMSHDKWLDLEVRQYDFVEGVYTILGGNMLIKPAMASTEYAKMYYQSANIWNTGSSYVAAPTDDAHTFRLDDRLLTLRTIWYWKSKKGLPYAEDMAEAEVALSAAIERDRGPRFVSVGRQTALVDATIAYPQRVVP